MSIFAAKTAQALEKQQASVLGMYFTLKAATGVQAVKDRLAAEAITAAAASGYLKGRIDEFLHIAVAGEATGQTYNCLQGATLDKTTLTIKNSDAVKCSFVPAGVNEESTTTPDITLTGFNKLKMVTADTAGTLQHTEDCPLLSSANPSLAGAAQTKADLNFAGGYITVSSGTAGSGNFTELKTDTLAPPTSEGNEICHAVQTAIKPLLNNKPEKEPINNQTIATSNEFKEAIKAFAGIKEDTTGEKTKQKKNEIFTADAAAAIQRFLTDVDKTEIPTTPAITSAPRPLSQINDEGTLAKLDWNCKLQAWKEVQKSPSQNCPLHPGNEKKTQQACDSHHADRAACNGKDFCTYDETESTDKKRKFNATKATKNSVHVPQTQTGAGESTTDKFKDKKKDDRKFPDCKWDRAECKNYTSFVN
ncbi:Trypanosome variant surface glycoprotein (A-type)/Trypanosome variant surface glycoprotein C-terminal domain containing protein, putative [Trypanosoma equiperdum]|uniref:Trypanosome variant surface glycoprotein (A-type)/Trypanosome variant surface glycoprotein C-terminal domain containing protein, putative n=1 Tax=Trypanosoma equiperdum TaxID=5694 RepID=A0A1G4IEH6_TRYEQ|nr:Trypanosome variant surface glycoprotein (A-type)/Trypanosome variant surface glycoprotein C-terminal domain containing protein, putative [Trypanosoma equiperdum]